MATLLQIREKARDILNDTPSSSIFSDEYIDSAISDVVVEIYDGQKYSFAKTKQIYQGVQDATLSSSITTASTVLLVSDTTNYLSAGYVYIDQDIIQYTGKTSTTLTGCTGITVAHSSGSFVRPVFALPSNYNRRPVLEVYKGTVSKPIQYTYVDESDYWTSRIFYRFTFVSDTAGARYIMYYQGSTTDQLIFKYLKKPTEMVEDTDVCSLPDPYALKIIPTFAAARCQLLRGDNLDGEALNKLRFAKEELFRMNKHYGEQEEGVRKIIRSSYGSRRTDLFYSRRIK